MTIKRVLLIATPYIDLYGPIKSAAGYYFPLGLGYIAAFLKKHGFQVTLYEPEAQHMNYTSIRDIFRRDRPDVIGIGSSTPNFFNAIELAKIAKETCNCKVVLGGIHASALSNYIVEQFHDYFDFVVSGEGEHTMLEFMQHLKEEQTPKDVSGLSFWQGDQVVHNPARKPIENLDSLPYPARELLPMDLFFPNLHNARYPKCISIITSRGCPFKCSFCASGLTMGKRYRIHSAEYVLDEMEYLKKHYGAQQLLITDDSFTINRRRVITICEGMLKRNLQLKWFCFSQVNTMDEELLSLMKSAGCYNIGFGVESASQRILKLMGKTMSLEKCEKIFASARRLGLKTQAFFVFGMKGETAEEINETIDFAIRIKPTLAFFNMLVPYPGTQDFERFLSNIPLSQIDWKNFVAIGTTSVLNNSICNLENLLYRANWRFYIRPTQLLRLAVQIKTLYELKNYLKGGCGLLRQMLIWKQRK